MLRINCFENSVLGFDGGAWVSGYRAGGTVMSMCTFNACVIYEMKYAQVAGTYI